MKSMISVGALAVSLALVTTSANAGRVANTAIGTLAGLVVFGPVGAVAGAAVGYSAGHGIARSWGISRPPHRPSRRAQGKAEAAGSSVPLPRNKPADPELVQKVFRCIPRAMRRQKAEQRIAIGEENGLQTLRVHPSPIP